MEDAGAEEEFEVVNMLREPTGGHVKVGLHQKLAAAERGVATVVVESFGAAESGEQGG